MIESLDFVRVEQGSDAMRPGGWRGAAEGDLWLEGTTGTICNHFGWLLCLGKATDVRTESLGLSVRSLTLQEHCIDYTVYRKLH